MLDRTTWFTHFEQLPEKAQDYLMGDASALLEDATQKKLGYENDAWDRLMDVVWELYFFKLLRVEFENKLRAVTVDRVMEEVEKLLLLHIVLPLEDIVAWDVEARLLELGATQAEAQEVPRVSLRPVSYTTAVRRIAIQAKISLLGEEPVRKARDVLASYLNGVRTIEQVREVLRRPQQESGLGFSSEQAEAFLREMEVLRATTAILSEEEYAKWFVAFQREAQQTTVLPPELQRAAIETDEPPAVRLLRRPLDDVDQTVEGIVATLSLPMDLDAYLQKRIRNVVSTRIRDIRNAAQVRAILERDTKVGGMGFDTETATSVADQIERAYRTGREAVEASERRRLDAVTVEQAAKLEERRRKESEDHAKWYEQKVAPTQANPFGVAPSDPLPSGGAIRSSLDGVRGQPARLVGLIEELERFSIVEFRRLGTDAGENAQKILQKLETLRQESFARWTQGVEAWRCSPLQKAYLELVAQSFAAGKPVSELAAEKRITDPAIPTPEELGAMIELNRHIQL